MNKHIPCKRCSGRGFINWTFSEGNTGTATSYVCPDCNGSGVSVVPMTNADRIRASIEDNKKLAELTIKRKSVFRRTISWLFRHYTVHEFTIHFYDDEPEYEYDEENDTIPYSLMEWYKLWRDYENRRMTFNNWIDVFGPGIWDFTDKENDDITRDCLKSVRNWPVKKKDRIYWAKNEDSIWIYCYGRDFLGEDYWFIMKRK